MTKKKENCKSTLNVSETRCMCKTFSCFSGCNIRYSSEVAALISAPSRKRPLIVSTPNQSQDTNKTLRMRILQVKDESLL
jgi:hypothetical protein